MKEGPDISVKIILFIPFFEEDATDMFKLYKIPDAIEEVVFIIAFERIRQGDIKNDTPGADIDVLLLFFFFILRNEGRTEISKCKPSKLIRGEG